MRHALVKDGEIVEFREYAPNVDQSGLAPGKPRMLPVETVYDDYDPVSQARLGPTYTVESARVVERYASRAKNETEIAAMISGKDAEIEAEFMRLYCAPIAYSVGGVEYQFHADISARENITGVLQMYREAALVGVNLPDPRHWTPLGSDDPILITRAELAGLGISIGARKDQLHTIKKARQKALAAMTDPVEINAVDPTSGWDIP